MDLAEGKIYEHDDFNEFLLSIIKYLPLGKSFDPTGNYPKSIEIIPHMQQGSKVKNKVQAGRYFKGCII